MQRPRWTIQRLMTRIGVLALALAILAAAERESRASQCGTPIILAIFSMGLIAFLYGLVRLVLFAIRYPS